MKRIACVLIVVLLTAFQTFSYGGTNSANSILVIAPYKNSGTWVFDDKARGLNKEPFVAGIPHMIDNLVTNIPDATNGFRLLFSAEPFPGFQSKLIWRRSEAKGNWYYSEQFKAEGWLCASLFKYFKTAPREIYIKAEPLEKKTSAAELSDGSKWWGYADDGRCFEYRVTEEQLRKTPIWRLQDDFPPLSPRKAEIAATEQFHRLLKNTTNWTRDRISLEDIMGDSIHWIYLVQFTSGDICAGVPYHLPVIVLMNGTVVEPKITTQNSATISNAATGTKP